ncbi:hypothetical protein NBRC3299_2533 [Acetobacter pasteurianus NBRC 3299]|nr:hypothetical protein BBA71_02620 [Acetobacter pasteurianus]GCD76241.1 hypothetical protein NBRC3299_2533 [Acetobacter pasteurianus NBRC 3299]
MSIRFSVGVVCLCLAGGLLAGCASQPEGHRIPPQSFAPGLTTEPSATNDSHLTNDPSAPLNTPLCGTSARENMAMGVQNYPQPFSSGNSCVQNACFDTQTGTYIASDGTKRVCR